MDFMTREYGRAIILTNPAFYTQFGSTSVQWAQQKFSGAPSTTFPRLGGSFITQPNYIPRLQLCDTATTTSCKNLRYLTFGGLSKTFEYHNLVVPAGKDIRGVTNVYS